jgi:hypothetical protein
VAEHHASAQQKERSAKNGRGNPVVILWCHFLSRT